MDLQPTLTALVQGRLGETSEALAVSAWCASASAFSVEQQGSVAVRTGGKKVLLLSFVVAGWGGAMAGAHATLQDVNTALDRARAFMQARRAAVDGAEAPAYQPPAPAPTHSMIAAAPQPEPTQQYAQPGPEEDRYASLPARAAVSLVAASTTASPWAQPALSSYSGGGPGTPGGLGQRSRQLRAMRGFGEGGSTYSGSPEEGRSQAYAPSTPGLARSSSPPGELRDRAQRLRESKSVSGLPPAGSASPWAGGSTYSAAPSPFAGGRANSPWRGASPSRGGGDGDAGVSESSSVRMRAYNLLQQKKGMDAPSTFHMPPGAPGAASNGGGAMMEEFSPPADADTTNRAMPPARPAARSPAPAQRREVAGPTPAELAKVANQKLASDLKQTFLRNKVDLLEAFERFDADGSRSIDPSEFRQGLKALDLGLHDNQITGLLSVIDSDGNGQIDYFEFAESFGMRRATAASKSLAKRATVR